MALKKRCEAFTTCCKKRLRGAKKVPEKSQRKYQCAAGEHLARSRCYNGMVCNEKPSAEIHTAGANERSNGWV